MFREFLTTPGQPVDLAALIARYKEISIENPEIFISPAEHGILARFIWPLRHAKAAYMVGNHLATVALAGFVAEMVAILFSNTRPDDTPAEELERFEKLGHAQRVEQLKKLKLLQSDEIDTFGRVRAGRRDYLHIWSQHDERLAKRRGERTSTPHSSFRALWD